MYLAVWVGWAMLLAEVVIRSTTARSVVVSEPACGKPHCCVTKADEVCGEALEKPRSRDPDLSVHIESGLSCPVSVDLQFNTP
jgi:hypothetical protein